LLKEQITGCNMGFKAVRHPVEGYQYLVETSWIPFGF